MRPREHTYVADMVYVVAFPLVPYCRGGQVSGEALVRASQRCAVQREVSHTRCSALGKVLTVRLRLAEEDGAGPSVVRRVRLKGQFWKTRGNMIVMAALCRAGKWDVTNEPHKAAHFSASARILPTETRFIESSRCSAHLKSLRQIFFFCH